MASQYQLQTDPFTEQACDADYDECIEQMIAYDLGHGEEGYSLTLNDIAAISDDLISILLEPNLENRRLMLERFGWEQFLSQIGAESCSWDDEYGVLYRTNISDQDGNPIKIVCVTNSSPEPDGTFKDYYLFVPPQVTSARQAVAWTFGLKTSEYKPLQES
jgi:hypothetical protein